LKDTISDFKLVYVNTPLEECVKRDVKGMYAKALRGEMKGFTGIDAPFEEPKDAGLIVYTKEESLQESVEKIYQKFFK
jgi:adenylylsulfate kinase